ncbi:hypothetical protein VTJ83DRAFT_7110 [Remersonia thermophila]|uniref:Cupin type-2 domain-containing protein n=1 Tax=Remersonia thermophila TaxID=72144 RepID=A0ABR4D3J4_9PEZI
MSNEPTPTSTRTSDPPAPPPNLPQPSTLPQPKPLSSLPQLTRYITTHRASDGLAALHSQAPFIWAGFDEDNLGFAVPFTTSAFPADLNGDADLAAHDALVASGRLGLVSPGGTVCRVVDFAPGYACAMHRTKSLDYGVVLEGEVEMVLDGGDRAVLKRGDVAVQRGTNHQWVNTSATEWARMLFVLQDIQPIVVNGKELGEDLGPEGGLSKAEKKS